jgi:TrbM
MTKHQFICAVSSFLLVSASAQYYPPNTTTTEPAAQLGPTYSGAAPTNTRSGVVELSPGLAIQISPTAACNSGEDCVSGAAGAEQTNSADSSTSPGEANSEETPTVSSQSDELGGDQRLACEAILCLAAGQGVNECRPSLERYFSIKFRKASDTSRARQNFLNLCPQSEEQDTSAATLADASGSAGLCEAGVLNTTQISVGQPTFFGEDSIRSSMPSECASYFSAHPELEAPRYVGKPELGGRWVTAAEYPDALQKYQDLLNSGVFLLGRSH